jgi:D-arabinono-1,4-lactone oxidase
LNLGIQRTEVFIILLSFRLLESIGWFVMATDKFKATLPSRVLDILEKCDDDIPFRATAAHTHRTWAGTYSSLPELFIQPRSLPEIKKVISLARKCRRRITTVGCGHSPNEMTCTSSWLVNLDNFNNILSIDKETGVCVMQAGIRLYRLSEALDAAGLALPNLGSINEQSIAGAISTGTHGSSFHRGLLSENVLELKIMLSDLTNRSCSPTQDPDLFRAALLSLGALGIITEITFQAVPAFSLAWEQTIDTDARLFEQWDKGLWKDPDYVRVWWFPYMRRAVVWKANVVPRVDLESGKVKHRDPPTSYYDSWLGYAVYHNLLALSRYVPRILPWVEWFVFGMQYGFRNGESTKVSAVQPSQKAFLMNCLYSQWVNEWAIPLEKGPEALNKLAAWLHNQKERNKDDIPFSANGLWVHSPVEVRVSNSTQHTSAEANNRPFLDPTEKYGPTLYLNAIMYRPYHRDPRNYATERYYKGFEWLMKELGGRTHWAKHFDVSPRELERAYKSDLTEWRRVRDDADPQGMFVGPWHRQFVLGPSPSGHLDLEELGFVREPSASNGTFLQGNYDHGLDTV